MTSTHPGSYLAIDLGASSGRAVIGTLDGSVMRMEEIHRFATPMLEENGHLYWDIDALWSDIRTAVAKALAAVSDLRSISVDSWAVDYVPLDADGNALRNPHTLIAITRHAPVAPTTAISVSPVAPTPLRSRRASSFFRSIRCRRSSPTFPRTSPGELVRATAHSPAHRRIFPLSTCRDKMVAEATMASTTQLRRRAQLAPVVDCS